MSLGFGPAMHRIVFRGGDNFKVAWIVTLQALHELNPKTPGKIRILAVSLLASCPARVAKDVEVWTPEGQALVASALVLAHKLVMLGARFGRDDVGHAMHQVGVPGRGQSDCLRKDGGITGA